jgi:hypothetical protein
VNRPTPYRRTKHQNRRNITAPFFCGNSFAVDVSYQEDINERIEEESLFYVVNVFGLTVGVSLVVTFGFRLNPRSCYSVGLQPAARGPAHNNRSGPLP